MSVVGASRSGGGGGTCSDRLRPLLLRRDERAEIDLSQHTQPVKIQVAQQKRYKC